MTTSSQPRHFREWEIWLVEWQHEDGSYKARPALVVTSEAYNDNHPHVLFAQIRSKPPVGGNSWWHFHPGDPSFASTRLKKECYLHPRIQAIEKNRIIALPGRLNVFLTFTVKREIQISLGRDVPLDQDGIPESFTS